MGLFLEPLQISFFSLMPQVFKVYANFNKGLEGLPYVPNLAFLFNSLFIVLLNISKCRVGILEFPGVNILQKQNLKFNLRSQHKQKAICVCICFIHYGTMFLRTRTFLFENCLPVLKIVSDFFLLFLLTKINI